VAATAAVGGDPLEPCMHSRCVSPAKMLCAAMTTRAGSGSAKRQRVHVGTITGQFRSEVGDVVLACTLTLSLLLAMAADGQARE